MDEGQVLSELDQLYQLHFHGSSQLAFHDAISKVWATSGLDFRFFCPEALSRLGDLGRIHGLPTCLRQCLKQRLEAGELKTYEYRRVSKKLERLFEYSATNGLHYKFGTTERRNAILFDNVKLEEPLKTARSRVDEAGNPVGSEELKSKEREMEKLKRKSLLSSSNGGNRRAPLPHSVLVQKRVTDLDFGIQVTIEDQQILAELEQAETLSPSELAYYEEQARTHLEKGSFTEEVAGIVQTLLVASERQAGTDETVKESVDGLVEETQLIESSAEATSLYDMFSTLLTSSTIQGISADVSEFLYPFIEHYISNGWGGVLTSKEMSDLLQVEAFKKAEVVPAELGGLLAKSFILTLRHHSEAGALISIVEEKVLDFIVTQATTNQDFNLLLHITWILTHSSTSPDQLGCAIFSKLVDFLKNMAEDQFLLNNSTVISVLRLIQDRCRTYSTDTIQVTSKYLESGISQAGRTYCAQWLKRAATEADMFLDEKTLTILKDRLDDSDPCIKYNARAAFATEIHKQRSQWIPETFSHGILLSHIIATEPIILTLSGQQPEYFTFH